MNFKNILLMGLVLGVFAGCATWDGVKKDTSNAYKSTKKAIHDATAE